MCGRFVQERSLAELGELFDAEPLAEDPGPRYNVAPTDPAAVVVQRSDGRRGVTLYHWGLIPHWADSAADAARRINARSETVATSPAFREALHKRRCIVPADGFFEWSRRGSSRHPFFVRRADRRPLAFAGIWSSWRVTPDAPPRRTFAILTTIANDTIAPIHDRMPVVLAPATWEQWLSHGEATDGELLAIIGARPDDPYEAFAVPSLVNSVRNDGPELIERLAPLV